MNLSSRKVPFILVIFYYFLNFLDRFSKGTQISNFMKIRPVGAELFYADRRTDGQTNMTKLTVAFRSLANAPKIIELILYRKIVAVYSEIHTKHKYAYSTPRNM